VAVVVALLAQPPRLLPHCCHCCRRLRCRYQGTSAVLDLRVVPGHLLSDE
jgi:hypothetical protein